MIVRQRFDLFEVVLFPILDSGGKTCSLRGIELPTGFGFLVQRTDETAGMEGIMYRL